MKEKAKQNAREKKIQLNLLPEELRPRPVIRPVTAILLIIVILLGVGTYGFYKGKSNTDNKVDKLKAQQATLEQQTTAALKNPEIARLQSLITQVQVQVDAQGLPKQDYQSFMGSWVNWDQVLAQLYSLLPAGVSLDSVAEKAGNTLALEGTAPTTKAIFDYSLALEGNPEYFSSVSCPTVQTSEVEVDNQGQKTEVEVITFTLSLEVKSGGAGQ
jgi:Tfp pilus assembly protein PilN